METRGLTSEQIQALRRIGRNASELFVWVMDDEQDVAQLRRRLGQVAALVAEVCEALAGQVFPD